MAMTPEKTKERCTAFLLFAVVVSSLGGLLYGYHTGIISGALVFLTSSFHLSIADQAMVVSIILFGGLIGALGAGPIADKIGRKRAIAMTSVLFIIGAAMIALSESYAMILFSRFISGLGVGVISVAGPIYLAEISPPHYRGAFVACYQFALTVGILISFFINYLFAPSADWRWMFAIGIFPALFQIFALFFLPETPAWLFRNGFDEQGIKALQRLRRDKEWTHQIEAMKSSASHHKHGNWKALLSHQLRFVMIIGFCLSVFQQITGISTVIFYAPKIFQTAGIASATGAILATLGIGIINVIATCFSTWILDRVGRRILLLIGIGGMALCLALLSLAYFLNVGMIDIIAFISLIGYVAFFAIGLGPVTWVVLSEIYPLKVRGKAMTVAAFGNWLFNYLVSLTFLDFIGKMGPEGIFLMYALISAGAFWFIYRYIPETKGKSLEEIENLLIR
jgi:MFS transporter, SP family, galactose:H+ symporter